MGAVFSNQKQTPPQASTVTYNAVQPHLESKFSQHRELVEIVENLSYKSPHNRQKLETDFNNLLNTIRQQITKNDVEWIMQQLETITQRKNTITQRLTELQTYIGVISNNNTLGQEPQLKNLKNDLQVLEQELINLKRDETLLKEKKINLEQEQQGSEGGSNSSSKKNKSNPSKQNKTKQIHQNKTKQIHQNKTKQIHQNKTNQIHQRKRN